MLAWSVSVKAADPCLVEDADLVLADRLMCTLDKPVKLSPRRLRAGSVIGFAAYASGATSAMFRP
jgi:hypothetical protein